MKNILQDKKHMIPLVSQKPKAVDRILKQRWLLKRMLYHDTALYHNAISEVLNIKKVKVNNRENMIRKHNRVNEDVSNGQRAPNVEKE